MTPIKNNDCSHYLPDEEILINCGTSPVMTILNLGADPARIRYIILVHLQPDHMLCFASLTWYMSSVARVDTSKVTVFGPENFIEKPYPQRPNTLVTTARVPCRQS